MQIKYPVDKYSDHSGAVQRLQELNRQFAIEHGHPRKAYVQTFGCQMNARDSEKLVGILEQVGYEEIEEFRQEIISANASIRSNRNLRPRYHSAFHGVQLIGDFIEPKDIATLR